MGVKLNFWN